jgi:hypothetical protein
MLRTIFTIGIMALLGLFALKFVFGIMGGLLGLLLVLLGLAVKVAIVGAVIYLIIRVVSPGTARSLRNRWSGRLD